MPNSLSPPFKLLAETRNLAAVDCLEGLLDSNIPEVRRQATVALMHRKDNVSLDRLIGAFARTEPFSAQAWVSFQHRLLPRVLSLLEDPKNPLFRPALRIVSLCHVAEGYSSLVHAAEQTSLPYGVFAGKQLIELTLSLGGEMRLGKLSPTRELLLKRLVESLQDFAAHRNSQIAEAFLVCAAVNDAILQAILTQEDDKLLKILVRQWKVTMRSEALDLLVQLFGKHFVPRSVADIILHERKDSKMAIALARGTSNGISPAIANRLHQAGGVACSVEVQNDHSDLQQEERWQIWKLMAAGNISIPKLFEGIVSVLQVPSPQAQHVVADMLRHSKPPSGRHLLRTMAPFIAWENSPNSEPLDELPDYDPAVFRAQLRSLFRLRSEAEPILKAAIAEYFREFTMAKFIENVDVLVDDALVCFAEIIPLVEPQWDVSLLPRLESPDPKERCQAAIAAGYLEACPSLKMSLKKLLVDKYEMIQEEAEYALRKYADVSAPIASSAEALFDPAVASASS